MNSDLDDTLTDHDCFNYHDSDEASDGAPEIWDLDESEVMCETDFSISEGNKKLYYTVSYFLLFFQLCNRMSDRALKHNILMFISSVLKYIPTVLHGEGDNDSLTQLIGNFPKTINFIL